eukprot:CAMPEP_0197020582 /NCGR_PEP_ID=MMETSP1384-20130603/1397_1 /TAXON_ID=29189 /ORGANISM="Ammonia sp." /LENGTH=226 /DNA_ID=CAMNT_0042448237 /DNA_START=54 /DNA_END=734 /DNA_ORIENTATION=+
MRTCTSKYVGALSFAFVFIASVELQASEASTAPFKDLSTAQQWVDAFAAKQMQFWNNEKSWDDAFGDIMDAETFVRVVDGKLTRYEQVRAGAIYGRSKAQSVTSIKCTATQFGDRTLRRDCQAKVKRGKSPQTAAESVDVKTHDTVFFDHNGKVFRVETTSDGQQMGKWRVETLAEMPAAGFSPYHQVHYHPAYGAQITWRELSVIGATTLGLAYLYQRSRPIASK